MANVNPNSKRKARPKDDVVGGNDDKDDILDAVLDGKGTSQKRLKAGGGNAEPAKPVERAKPAEPRDQLAAYRGVPRAAQQAKYRNQTAGGGASSSSSSSSSSSAAAAAAAAAVANASGDSSSSSSSSSSDGNASLEASLALARRLQAEEDAEHGNSNEGRRGGSGGDSDKDRGDSDSIDRDAEFARQLGEEVARDPGAKGGGAAEGGGLSAPVLIDDGASLALADSLPAEETYEGAIHSWHPKNKYGFIVGSHGCGQLFVHTKRCVGLAVGQKYIPFDTKVTYGTKWYCEGYGNQLQACNVKILDREASRGGGGGGGGRSSSSSEPFLYPISPVLGHDESPKGAVLNEFMVEGGWEDMSDPTENTEGKFLKDPLENFRQWTEGCAIISWGNFKNDVTKYRYQCPPFVRGGVAECPRQK
eukprot:g2271.t1